MRTGLIAEALLALWVTTASAQEASKPNILVILGDDIGLLNVSAYTWDHGLPDAEHRPDRATRA